MLLGDFNCVTDSQRDVRGPGFGRSTWNARELRRLIQHFDLVDCWTLLHSTTFEHTWRRGHSSSRLDRVYVNESPAVSVVACSPVDIPPTAGYISDHRPVLVELHLTTMANQQRLWRLDTRVLRDPTSRDRLRDASSYATRSCPRPQELGALAGDVASGVRGRGPSPTTTTGRSAKRYCVADSHRAKRRRRDWTDARIHHTAPCPVPTTTQALHQHSHCPSGTHRTFYSSRSHPVRVQD
ncbi:unnamed protein product [Ixodes hexagonus]